MANKIYVPWSEEQVLALNAMQAAGFMHEYTCGNEGCHRILVAIDEGWLCPSIGCGYTQGWAHEPMTEAELTRARLRYVLGQASRSLTE